MRKWLQMLRRPFVINNRKEEDRGLNNDHGLKIVVNMMALGLVAIVVVGLWAWLVNEKYDFAAVLGLSMIVGFASLFTGAIFGFLFGIPRSLQRTDPVSTETGKERPYSNNTNLEQISDWLTKIIVGVSLTQLPAIQGHFHVLVSSVSNGFQKFMSASYAYPYSSGLIIFYSISGFLAVYIWAKVYFLEQLTFLEDRLNRRNIRDEIREVRKGNQKLEISRLGNMLTQFIRSRNRINSMESKYKALLDIAQPAPVKFIDDCQKERWGGQSVSGGYALSAAIRLPTRSDESNEDDYIITLTVKPVQPNTPLTGDVYFFLHDSFYEEYIKIVNPENNMAVHEFNSFEAFTVAAVLNNGAVKLELDLNSLPDIPEGYKYSSPLLSYEEVKNERDRLLEEGKKVISSEPSV